MGAAWVILLHLSLLPLCQATVSECLSCAATSSMNNAAADACRAGDAATVPKVACADQWNHGCSVTVQNYGGITTWTRSCCPESTCQDDVHTNANGQEFDADSCETDNCNTMDPTSGSTDSTGTTGSSGSSSISGFNLLLLVLFFGSTTSLG